MANLYPESVKFYLADNIHVDTGNGKPTLFGLYVNDIVVVFLPADHPGPNLQAAVVIEGLAVVTALINVGGHFAAHVTLRSPDGTTIVSQPLGEIDITAPGPGVLSTRFQPFLIPQFGIFKVTLVLSEREYEHSFEVQRGLLPTTQHKPVEPKRAKAKKKSRV